MHICPLYTMVFGNRNPLTVFKSLAYHLGCRAEDKHIKRLTHKTDQKHTQALLSLSSAGFKLNNNQQSMAGPLSTLPPPPLTPTSVR